MRIKNVVKVMNFHSLLRVDASKREAESYRNVGDEITKIIKTIVYNKNLVLDKKVIMPNPNNNKLNIYIANDYGFCGVNAYRVGVGRLVLYGVWVDFDGSLLAPHLLGGVFVFPR